MGTVYGRNNKLWIGYKDVDGTRRYSPTKFTVGQEPKARKLLDAIERRSSRCQPRTSRARSAYRQALPGALD